MFDSRGLSLALSSVGLMAVAKWPGGYEPVTVAPPTANVMVRSMMATRTGHIVTPVITPLVADIKFGRELSPGMFVTFWTSPVSGHLGSSSMPSKIGTPTQRIPGLSPTLLSYDKDQDWFNQPSSRRGKVKILHPTSRLKMTFGLVPVSSGLAAKDFMFHFIVRSGDYDTVLDSGTKIIHLVKKRR